MATEKLLLRISEVAMALGVSKSTAYSMAASGELPVIRIRGGLRVPTDALESWILDKMNGADGIVTTAASASGHGPRR